MNEELDVNFVSLPNTSVLETKIPFDIFQILVDAINVPSDTLQKYNSNLLGHLEEEYNLDHLKPKVENYIKEIASVYAENNLPYINSFEEVRKNKNYKLALESLWFNKQKKHEFNPVHLHSGILSFVIFLKIPYDLTDEDMVYPETSGISGYSSKFSFYYTDILGIIRQELLPVDKNWEGTMIMFPSTLQHGVHPFYTSDDYRITVSGNLQVEVIND